MPLLRRAFLLAAVLLPVGGWHAHPRPERRSNAVLRALGSELAIPELGPMGESVYRNYTLEDGPTQVEELVRVVRAIIAARATRLVERKSRGAERPE